jgi:hypothetical protein
LGGRAKRRHVPRRLPALFFTENLHTLWPALIGQMLQLNCQNHVRSYAWGKGVMNVLFILICVVSLLFFGVFLVQCSVPRKAPRRSPTVRKVSTSKAADYVAGRRALIHVEQQMAEFLSHPQPKYCSLVSCDDRAWHFHADKTRKQRRACSRASVVVSKSGQPWRGRLRRHSSPADSLDVAIKT